MNQLQKERAARSSRTAFYFGEVKTALLTAPPKEAAKLAHIYARLTLRLFLK
ncbi:MAG: hypothetical protein II368_02535 [Clostridia bacterium]|jgi:hypothetical protein|nr:hypothetical protein [Clostridia bacterium]MBQ5802038.1 hypothetical protein [Clostridia bacterium]